jgi:deazaflavin-dependent oxidoreductase (nitroreductase family)
MMNASNIGAAAPGQAAVVRPSRFVRVVMGPMTKMLNPAMMKLAGRRHVLMAAQVRHVGRKSGRPYVTPVGARLAGDTFVIPLTFGNQSDWSRNVRAAGGCSIRLNGVDYQVDQPELADRAQAGPVVRAAYNPVMRAGFRMLGIRQFLLLKLVDR